MRSLIIILLLLTICLVIFDVAQAKGKRIVNFKPCSLRLMIGTPYRPKGCSMVMYKRIKAYGCQGYCESETISRTDRKELSKRCTCCMATGFRRTRNAMVCSKLIDGRLRQTYHIFSVLSATNCQCRKCNPKTR